MSSSAVEYYDFLLRANFGDVAVAVSKCMHTKGAVSIRDIDRCVSGHLGPRRAAICIMALLRHEILRYIPGQVNKYCLNWDGICRLARIPIYSNICLLFYGEMANDLLISLFSHGISKSSEILRVALILQNTGPQNYYEVAEQLLSSFENLIKTGLLKYVKPTFIKDSLIVDEESTSADLTLFSKTELFSSLKQFISMGARPNALRQQSMSNSTDWDVLITPNMDTLDALWRDRLIAQFASERIDETAGHILSRVLCIATASGRSTYILSSASDAVSHTELVRSLKEIPKYLDSYITLLLDDQCALLEQQPGIAGGMYFCPYKKIVKNMLLRHAENLVQIQFDNAGLRIFRILSAEGYLTHDVLERRLLIPQKDFRKVLPLMVASGFIASTEFSKAKDFTADTIVCLYHIDLTLLARLILELAQKTLLRLGVRYQTELSEKSRLIEQRHRVECLIDQHQEKIAQILNLANTTKGSGDNSVDSDVGLEHHEESVRALKSSIAPAELEHLTSLTNRLSKLSAAQWESHTAWFLADLYLRLYSQR